VRTSLAAKHVRMDAEERSRRLAAGESVAEAVAGPAWATHGPLMDSVRAGEFATSVVRGWREQIRDARRTRG
jgi:hypothetical protein